MPILPLYPNIHASCRRGVSTRAAAANFFAFSAVLAWLLLGAAPTAAWVGGAPMAEQGLARHVVLIVGGHNLCTGVALAPDLVLTAAHCVMANGRYRLRAFEGRRPSVKEVASIAPHPQFSLRSDSPDLAVVKLAAQPPANLAPVVLSDRRAPPSVGDRFIVVGFGVAVQGDSRTAGRLRAAAPGATDRPRSPQLRLGGPRKPGEAGRLGGGHRASRGAGWTSGTAPGWAW